MKKKANMKTLMLTALSVLALAGTAVAGPMESANYKIPASVVASGGGSSASAAYQMVATIGEPAIGPSESTSHDLYAGFMPALLAVLPIPGDVTGDGAVDTSDVLMLLRIAGGLTNATDGRPDNGDVTGNGAISLEDAAKVLRYLNGLQPSLP